MVVCCVGVFGFVGFLIEEIDLVVWNVVFVVNVIGFFFVF